MLLNLNIKNYALIEDLDINFSDSFTVISGDTGSGKSIILDAISLLLGSRVDKKKLGSKKCIVEGSFKISSDLKFFFNDNDLDFEKITCIRREINNIGKIRNFINDTPVNLSTLSNLSSKIIEIHAQHHNLLIKNKIEQLNIIDKIAENSSTLSDYRKVLEKFISYENELGDFESRKKLSDDDYKLYKYYLQEILDADIKEDEEIDLEREINLYENINQIVEITQVSNHLLNKENYVLDLLNKIKFSFSKFSQFDELNKRINSSIIDLNDISHELSDLEQELTSDGFSLENKIERFDLINKILKKHNLTSSKEINHLFQKIEKEIKIYENFELEKSKIILNIKKAKDKLIVNSSLLTKSRLKTIPFFEKEITKLLKTLGMPHAIFKVKLGVSHIFNKNGVDDISFEFSSNPGVKEQDISKIASGGEISRLVLALKYIVSVKSNIKTIIFDEIDTGVSGKIASFMGDLMRSISKQNQLISVTHLPQIASKSDEHIKVFKVVKENKTRTEIKVLEKEERVLEVARLLSGKKISNAAITNAKELLNQ